MGTGMLHTAMKNGLRKLGYVLNRYDSRRDPLVVRKHYLQSHGINVVFDVGANVGQFALELRESGYQGKIVSFEPLSSAFRKLAEVAHKDHDWLAEHYALGDKEAAAEINLAENSWSSSLLDILPAAIKAASNARYVGKEAISIRTLDAVWQKYCDSDSRVFLKIDAHGYTRKIMEAGERCLKALLGLQIEMSLVPLYEGEPLIAELVSFLQARGFTLVYIFPEFFDNKTGQQLQVNGLFFRT